MSVSNPFGIGSFATGGWRLDAPRAGAKSAIAFNSPGISLDDVRDRIQSAASAIADAFRAFRKETRPIYTPTVMTTAPSTAEARGIAASLTAVSGRPSVLQTTLKVNSQTSTERSSSSSLGLDVASVESASRLDSSAALGLDVTSAETPSSLASNAALGLDLNSRSSTITSTAQMNTDTTSYGSTTLSFTGSGLPSTSAGTLTGTYTGVNTAAAATSLTVKITSTSTLNSLIAANVKFEVRDQNNSLLFSYNGNLKAGDQVYLGADIGLSISFSAGNLTQNHTAATTVSHAAVDVDANAAFNASASLRPKFDNGAQVTAGSFTVNGTSITVNANDTINTVLSRINSSTAGVTATLAGDKITLTTNAASESNIVLASDTSGFLAATKLNNASTVRGNIRDDQQALAATTQFASVVNGSFTINGTSISVNKTTDTVASIVSRINSSSAGVTAAYDSSIDKITLTGTIKSEDLITAANDTSGFLTAAKLSTNNTVRGNIRDDQQVLSKTSQFGSVTNGTFTINGQSISVNSSTDTLTTIIAKINSANAGVTASFNASSNKIEIVGTSNSEDLITVAGDTSGFLTAAQLSTNNTVRGNIRDDSQTFAKTSQFSSVTSGSFKVNGVSISVNPSQDTLQTIIDKINSAGAGVTVSYNSTSDKLVFTPNIPGAALTLEDDASGFLAAVHVSQGTVGTHVNADATFNGTGANDPLFDPGVRVHAGSFTVNGVSITVGTSDSLNSVLSRITASAAGVTATYDNTAQTVRLITNEGSTTPITVADDTSGFLAAVKLDGTVESTPGVMSVAPFDSNLSKISEYSSVHAGTVSVNGHDIAIDPATTTIRGFTSAVNSIAGVSAAFSETTGELRFTSEVSGGTVSLSDTSGLLAALRIPAGIHQGPAGAAPAVETQTGTRTVTNSGEVADRVAGAVDNLNGALQDLPNIRDNIQGRLDVATMIQDAIGSLSAQGLQGLKFSSAEMCVSIDREKLVRSLDEKMAGGDEDVDTAIGRLIEPFSERSGLAAAPGTQSAMSSKFQISHFTAQAMAAQVKRTLNFLSVISAYKAPSVEKIEDR